MRKFAVPYPDESGNLPTIHVQEIPANKDTTTAHDPDAINVALARRDLNIIPTFLPGINIILYNYTACYIIIIYHNYIANLLLLKIH